MKRLLLKHIYKIRHITNPYRAGGNVITDDIPYIEIIVSKRLMEIGQATITLPNGWIKADGKNILTRTFFDEGDIIEIWRDKELYFSGVIFKTIELSFETVVINLFSHIWFLTQQYTGVESY